MKRREVALGHIHADDAITVASPLSSVWQAMSDFGAYPLWWPSSAHLTVRRVTPEKVGSSFELRPYISYRIDPEIADRTTTLISYVLPVSRIHSRLMRHVFEGLQSHLASGARSTSPS